MDLWYVIFSVLLLVIVSTMIPIRVRNKVVVVLHEAQIAKKDGQEGDSPSARYARKAETVTGILVVTVFFLILAFGYIAPYADWYEFESRAVFFGFVGLCAFVYFDRTIAAFKKAQHIKAALERSKESGES